LLSSAPPDDQAQRIAALREQLEPLMDAPEPAKGLVEKWLKALDKKPLVYWRAYGVVLSNRSLETHRGSSLPVVTEHAEALEEAFLLIARTIKDYPQFVRRRAFGRIAAALNEQPDASQRECITLCLTVLDTVLRETYADVDPDTHPEA
jgi:hypothetical protein